MRHTSTADTGFFWFFDRDNPELIIKILDGRPISNSFWEGRSRFRQSNKEPGQGLAL